MESSEEEVAGGEEKGVDDSPTAAGSQRSQPRGYIEAKSKRQKLKEKRRRQKEKKKAARCDPEMRDEERSTEEEDSPNPFTFSPLPPDPTHPFIRPGQTLIASGVTTADTLISSVAWAVVPASGASAAAT
jgi:hypothetical protein